MEDNHYNYQKVKKEYLKFISSQEVMSEPFRDKLKQLNKFYLPISKMIKDEYIKKKKNQSNRFNWWAGNWKIYNIKRFKNNSKRGL